MAYKVFADANVYLDLFLQRGSNWKDVEVLFDFAAQKEIEVFTSASNVLNLMYIMKTYEFTRLEIIKHSSALLSFTTLLNPDNIIFNAALTSGFNDLEDAVQYFTAKNVTDIDYFITSNIKDFKKADATLPVVSPSQFMKMYKKNKAL
ncbi:MAG: type II toxin-antitoxin system VapC family toxin [Ilyomonas sp.]